MIQKFLKTGLFLGVVILVSLSFLPLECNGSLSIQKSHSQESPTFTTINLNEGSESDGYSASHDRKKRDVVAPASGSNSSSKIKTDHNVLQDSHNQLLVHYAGEEVIICLAKDTKLNSTSTLFISRDYGASFQNATDQLTLSNGTPAQLDRFFNHPKHNGRFVFNDVVNKYIFTSIDFGKSLKKSSVNFVPDTILFDPVQADNIIALESATINKELWVSRNFGETWDRVQLHVKSVSWDDSTIPPKLYIQRESPNGKSVILSSDSLFLDSKDLNIAVADVEEFQIKDEYKFASSKKDNNTLELLISYKSGIFKPALFPLTHSSHAAQHFHVADISAEGQIFVCVVHNESVANLYVGNVPDEDQSIQFSLSLERIVFFKPNTTWSESWLNMVTEEEFVDLHAVEGLRGVYIASQLKKSASWSKKFGLDEVVSWITYDQGGEWELLKPPKFDDDGNPIYCQYTTKNCSLHISQHLSQLYPSYRAVPILSKKSAVGLILATGTVNTTLKGRIGVYISTDGAANWRQLLQGNYLYGFGDHGGIIAATKFYKIGESTNELIYSIDEGETWETHVFYEEPVRVLGLLTEPGENTTVFFVFASISKNTSHSWVLIKVDFRDVFERNCTKDDYKWWSPWDSKPGRHCLLGQKEEYERRDPKQKCYNGQGYERPIMRKVCSCERSDYECDFGYVEDPRTEGKLCLKDNSETSPGVKAEWCKPGVQFYNKTKGYRKVPGTKCEESDEVSKYTPETISCPVSNELEFMLVAKRDSILRIDLNDFSRIETLPIPRVRTVIALDYDLKNNCIFWSDVNRDHIMKLHLDGESEPELLVSSNIQSVEGLAYDWLAHNLYFSDGAQSKIEVIRTDAHRFGRMRKKLLGLPIVEKPRGLAVHPAKGFLFWTDWSADKPCIGRSLLDGSDARRIIVNEHGLQRVKWPNGITVDYTENRLYWVDAFLDIMTTSNLDGGDIQNFIKNDNRVNHPFAVGVYKNLVYWDDWTTRSIYYARVDADDVSKSIFLVAGNQSRLMDLKVYGSGLQVGSNNCSGKSNNCSHLCFSYPNETMSCECPDGLRKNGNACLCPDGKPLQDNGSCGSYCEAKDSFKCASGFCVPKAWVCDGDDDCGDNSDEQKCDRPICTAVQFQCNITGKCIPETFRCDFDHDCGDGDESDEEGCEGQYPVCRNDTQFQCDNGRCILKKWVCDLEDDCGDGGSDEKNCPEVHHLCGINEYKCEREEKCLSVDWVCDGDKDCESGSDEQNCTTKRCPEWKFHCKSGECIMQSWECDGDKDCPDGSDEHADCPAVTTPAATIDPFPRGNCSGQSQMFECSNSKECIPVFWKCDGAKDCLDGSDELGCSETPDIQPGNVTLSPPGERCPVNHWRCLSGECIAMSSRCDKFYDCPGKEDETVGCHDDSKGGCPKNYERCGLTKVCIPKEEMCDGKPDCPFGLDEQACGNVSIPACNAGEFRCDGDDCKPLYMMCNKKSDCSDGSDEDITSCKKHQTVYQIAGMSVGLIYEEPQELELAWWVDPTLKGNMTFLPSYCEIYSGQAVHCKNETHWITERSFVIGKTEKLSPYTKYSITVYVQKNGEVFHPAIFKNKTTLETEPGAPFGLQVKQPNADELTISWKKPANPNGQITNYNLAFHPPLPPATVESKETEITISNKQSDPVFRSGVNYTFWVTAENSAGESNHSEPLVYLFNGDIAMISELRIKEPKEDAAMINWRASNDKYDEFTVILETVGALYSFKTFSATKDSYIQFYNLAPKTEYKVSIIPVLKKVHGSAQSISFSTKGEKLPRVKGLLVKLSKVDNKVNVTWDPVQGSYWVYGIYYGKSTHEISQNQPKATTSTFFVVEDLEACEEYLFDIGLIGPRGMGPLTEAPTQVKTLMDEKSPPKQVRINEIGSGNDISLEVTWKAPCPVLDNPLSYNITMREVTTNKIYGLAKIQLSNKTELSHTLKIFYGGQYELNISTSVPGAKSSAPLTFTAPPIPFPEQLDQCTECHPFTILWEAPRLPKMVTAKGKVTYVVWISKDTTFEHAERHETEKLNFPLSDLKLNGERYYIAVSVKDRDGLESPRSSPMVLETTELTPEIMISTSNALAIALTVIVIILLLLAVLGIFVVRHKRLQTSFLNFASSHYSSHSGAATFQQNQVEEQEDSPIIRGFSDDEPLLVA